MMTRARGPRIVQENLVGRKAPDRLPKVSRNTAQWNRLADWLAIKEVVHLSVSRGCPMFMEWPRACEYWRDPDVQSFIRRHGFGSAVIAGCRVGLVSGRPGHAGRPLRKEWRVDCSDPGIAEYLRLPCACPHAACIPVEGPDTRPSEAYTDLFAAAVAGACRIHESRARSVS